MQPKIIQIIPRGHELIGLTEDGNPVDLTDWAITDKMPRPMTPQIIQIITHNGSLFGLSDDGRLFEYQTAPMDDPFSTNCGWVEQPNCFADLSEPCPARTGKTKSPPDTLR